MLILWYSCKDKTYGRRRDHYGDEEILMGWKAWVSKLRQLSEINTEQCISNIMSDPLNAHKLPPGRSDIDLNENGIYLAEF